MAILKGLVSVAWADGRVADEEVEVIEALLDAFDASPSERAEIRAYARSPRNLDEIPITDLSYDDRRVLLQHAVLITFIDGEQHESERALIERLCERLRIGDEEGRTLIAAASERARQLVNMLAAPPAV